MIINDVHNALSGLQPGSDFQHGMTPADFPAVLLCFPKPRQESICKWRISWYGCLQVALVSGLDADALKKLNSSSEGSQHIHKLLRVLTVRTEAGKDRSGIMLVGGPHDPKVDGSATTRYIQLSFHQNACSCNRQQDIVIGNMNGNAVHKSLSCSSSVLHVQAHLLVKLKWTP